jgi:hypothetical protein
LKHKEAGKQTQEDTKIYLGKTLLHKGEKPNKLFLERISLPIQYNQEPTLSTRENQQRRILISTRANQQRRILISTRDNPTMQLHQSLARALE